MSLRTAPALVTLALAAVLALACGDNDDTGRSASPTATPMSASATPEGVLSVEGALALDKDTGAHVRGFLVAAPSGQVRLCEMLAAPFPRCGGASLDLFGLVLSNVDGLRSAEDAAPGLFWTETPVVVIGLVRPVFTADARGAVRRSGAVLVVDPGSPEGAVPTTGVAEVDNVVRRVLLRGGASLDVTYAVVECTQKRAAGEPPHCDDLGVPTGTMLETLPASSCEGSYVPKPQIRGFLDSMVGARGPLLDFHGAFVPAQHPFGEGRPTPDYAVLFLPRGQDRQRGYQALYLDDARKRVRPAAPA